jgi:hypothetical protein
MMTLGGGKRFSLENLELREPTRVPHHLQPPLGPEVHLDFQFLDLASVLRERMCSLVLVLLSLLLPVFSSPVVVHGEGCAGARCLSSKSSSSSSTLGECIPRWEDVHSDGVGLKERALPRHLAATSVRVPSFPAVSASEL